MREQLKTHVLVYSIKGLHRGAKVIDGRGRTRVLDHTPLFFASFNATDEFHARMIERQRMAKTCRVPIFVAVVTLEQSRTVATYGLYPDGMPDEWQDELAIKRLHHKVARQGHTTRKAE